jgi:alpha-ketoglutarate-dependent taurine dioxygenase
MSNPAETLPSTSTPYLEEGLADEAAIVQWLDDTPTYNGVLRVFRGDFSPEPFTQALGESTKYKIIDGAEGPYSAIQGTGGGNGGTADRSKRSDPFDYHTDGFFFDTPPPLFSLVCENPGESNSKTSFVDTKEVLRKVEDYMPILGLLKFRYISKSLQRYSRPLVESHTIDGAPITNLVTRGYVEPEVDADSLAALPDFRFMNEAMSALYSAIDDSVAYEHSWQKGDVLVADNHTFIHARLAKTPDAARRLSRIWLGHAGKTYSPTAGESK